MINTAATTRVGVLACTQRAQEYARRILRSMGYAPLVFANVQELAALGPNASKLRMLFVGGHPIDIAERDSRLLVGIRAVIGSRVPVLYCPLGNAPRAIYQGAANGVIPDSSQYFVDLCIAVSEFMESHGLRGLPPLLRWDGYTFHLLRGEVSFAGRQVQLVPLSFDTALELFYNAGKTVTPECLKSMLPSGRARPSNPSFGKIVHGLQVSLELGCGHGWDLEFMPCEGYRLFRSCLATIGHSVGSLQRPLRTTRRELSDQTVSLSK